ncbi:hypothetical protein TB2_033930 [Malus domestica]
MVDTAPNPFYLSFFRPFKGEAAGQLNSSGKNFKQVQSTQDQVPYVSEDASSSIIPMQTELSFKDKLLGIGKRVDGYPNLGTKDDHFNIGDGDFEVTNTKMSLDIHFVAKVKEQMYKYLHNSVIIKFIKKCHAYNFVLACLKQQWNLNGPMQFVDMANYFFIVHFLLEEDLLFVVTGGMWIIDGQYLAVQQRTPNFCAAEEEISYLIV